MQIQPLAAHRAESLIGIRGQQVAAIQAAAGASAVKKNLPPPSPPFTDFRYEEPGKVRVQTHALIQSCSTNFFPSLS